MSRSRFLAAPIGAVIAACMAQAIPFVTIPLAARADCFVSTGGTCAVPPPDNDPTATGAGVLPTDPTGQTYRVPANFEAKETAAEQELPWVSQNLALNEMSIAAAAIPAIEGCGTDCAPQSGRLPDWGLEAQVKSYYCGPAAARNALKYIMGTAAPDQYTLANYSNLQTDYRGETDGMDNFAQVLNNYQQRNWYIPQAPGDPDTLMTWVTEDISDYDAATIANFIVSPLPWFNENNHHRTWMHYDVIAGWDTYKQPGENAAGNYTIGEVYDGPTWGAAGVESYGYKYTSQANIYAAVHGSASHEVLW